MALVEEYVTQKEMEDNRIEDLKMVENKLKKKLELPDIPLAKGSIIIGIKKYDSQNTTNSNDSIEAKKVLAVQTQV